MTLLYVLVYTLCTLCCIHSLQYEDGGTVLSLASKKGHTQTVLLLLSHGAIVDHQDNVSVYISSEMWQDFCGINFHLNVKQLMPNYAHNIHI